MSSWAPTDVGIFTRSIDVTPPIRSYVLSTEHDDAPLLASLRRWDDFLCNYVGAETSYGSREEPDIDTFVLMSGRCSTLRIAGSLAEDGQ